MPQRIGVRVTVADVQARTIGTRDVEPNPYDHTCPMCGCENNSMIGVLGHRVHVRCEDCGINYSYMPTREELDDLLTNYMED